MKWYAIIVAAGSSRRAGFDKLVAPLSGEPVLRRSVGAFVQAGADGIVLVCPESRWCEVGLDALRETLPIPLLRVDGGAQRQDSVYAGLLALPEDCAYVAVHDGARPLIAPRAILDCLSKARETGAAACAQPVVDTLKRVDEAGRTLPEFVNRDELWAMQTPQIFDLGLLKEAYECLRAADAVATDEVSAMEQLGHATTLVAGGANMKITLPDDLRYAEILWQQLHRESCDESGL